MCSDLGLVTAPYTLGACAGALGGTGGSLSGLGTGLFLGSKHTRLGCLAGAGCGIQTLHPVPIEKDIHTRSDSQKLNKIWEPNLIEH